MEEIKRIIYDRKFSFQVRPLQTIGLPLSAIPVNGFVVLFGLVVSGIPRQSKFFILTSPFFLACYIIASLQPGQSQVVGSCGMQLDLRSLVLGLYEVYVDESL